MDATQHMTRSRWAAIGAAVAVTLGAGGIGLASATSPGDAVTYVPVEPCRLVDTRAGDFNVGDRSTPLGPDEAASFMAHGDNGECTGIPTTATGLGLNVTAVGPSQETVLTIWGSGDQPNASSLNPAPGQPPTPNAVTSGLTGAGEINIWNAFGTVDVVVDIVGYYTDHNHDDRYYTEAEVDTTLDGYYTKSEVDALLAPFSNSAAAFVGGDQIVAINTSGVEIVRTVALQAPDDGVLVVTASANIQQTGVGDANARCSITLLGTLDTDHLQLVTVPDDETAAAVALTRGFAVPTGAVVSANLVCDTSSGTANVRDSAMTAIFSPS